MEGRGGSAETASVRLVLASSSARGALTKTAIRRPAPARFGRGGSVRDRSLQPPRGETARDWLTVRPEDGGETDDLKKSSLTGSGRIKKGAANVASVGEVACKSRAA